MSGPAKVHPPFDPDAPFDEAMAALGLIDGSTAMIEAIRANVEAATVLLATAPPGGVPRKALGRLYTAAAALARAAAEAQMASPEPV